MAKRGSFLARWHRRAPEFKPDESGSSLRKLLHMTYVQRMTYLRWALYIAVSVLMLVVQDTIMSRVAILDATTDLAPAVIIVIAIIENCEVGSTYAFAASLFYYFSGSAPGAYCIAILTVCAMFGSMLRQKLLHRSVGTVCAVGTAAIVVYELLLWAFGLFLGLTRFSRVLIFLLTGLYSGVTMIPMYFLLAKIGSIGGNQWKE